jgi:hypothetical protein
MLDKNLIADVMEKTALFLDAQETEKTASAHAERAQVVDTFAEKYASATGEELPQKVREQLIHSDVNLMTAFEKMAGIAGRHDQAPSDLGSPASYSEGPPEPATVKEAADRAGDAFVNWIVND